jgi:hypothetical protein
MENLNKRISQIVLDKVMIEKQIEVLTKGAGSMTLAVEHSANKIWQMERKTANQEKVYRNYEKDSVKLRSTNQYLSERLEKVLRCNEQKSKHPTNLLLEIERSVPDYNNILETADNELAGDSCEDIVVESDEEIYELNTELEYLRSEAFSANQQARNMCDSLHRRDLTQSRQTSCVDSGPSDHDGVLLELQALLLKMGSTDCESETVTCQDIKIDLEIELHQTKESFEKAEMRLKQVDNFNSCKN